MSSASSAVTYTSVYTNSEPRMLFWGTDEELSDEGSTQVIVYEYDGLPMQAVAPPSPNYIPGLEEPQTPPVSQDEDEQDKHVLPAKEQPLPPVDLPTAESPGYVVESDPEEDLEEYEDDESEDGPVDYPMDRGDDGDDDDGDSFGNDADDEDEDEEDDDEEEHLALTDAAVVVPTVEPVSLPEGTEPFIPPPSTEITTTRARITVRLQASISLPPEVEVERLLAMPTPPPSPLTSLSPPSAGERLARCMTPSTHSSPPPVPSPSLPSSGCPTQIQALRIASTQALIDAVTATLPLPPLPPPLYIPPPIDRRDDIPETELPPRKKSCLFALGPRYEVEESSTAILTGGRGIDYGFVSTLDAEARRRGIREVGYVIRDTWVDPGEAVYEIAPMTLREVNTRVIELAEIHEYDIQDLYALLEDAHDSRTRLSPRVTMDSQWVDLLMEDRVAHQETILIVKEEACASREAWAHSIGLSQAVHYELQTHCKQGEIKKLEIELWNLKVKGNDVLTYTNRFQELTLICTKFVANETEKIDKYISGIPDNINSAPMRKGRLTTKGRLMIHPETTMAINNTPPRGKMSPWFTICGWVKGNHMGETCPRDNRAITKGNGCFECGAPGHFKRDCLKLKNKNEESVNVRGWVYAVGNAEKKGNASRDLDSNVVTGTFLLNNRYTSILYDTGADRSFMSTAFSSLINIVPTPLGNSYDVELDDGKIVGAQEYMAKGCQIFLAQISAKKEEDKSEGKQLKDVPIIQDFPEVFLEDLPGLPPARPVEFQIDLIPRAAPVARAPYRLAPSKMKELSEQR
nr:hypothetical protein [Tanacetum cinerariifolium]